MKRNSPRARPASTDLESILRFMGIGGLISLPRVLDIHEQIYPSTNRSSPFHVGLFIGGITAFMNVRSIFSKRPVGLETGRIRLSPRQVKQRPHSYLSAIVGSIRLARSAGINPAKHATLTSASVQITSVAGSCGANP